MQLKGIGCRLTTIEKDPAQIHDVVSKLDRGARALTPVEAVSDLEDNVGPSIRLPKPECGQRPAFGSGRRGKPMDFSQS